MMRLLLRSAIAALALAFVLPIARDSVTLTPLQATYGSTCAPARGRTTVAWIHNAELIARCGGYFVAQASGNVVVFITSGTSYTVPANFASLVSIECIGTGTNGNAGTSLHPGNGGAGSYYAKITSLTGISANNTYSISIGNPTWFDSSTTVAASDSSATGSTTYAGGAGGAYGSMGGGGGGAAGPTGAGTAGASGNSGGAGGAGDSYTWTATAGGTASPGTGGNGGSGGLGSAGGNYGAGGGGGDTTYAGGAGGAGIIVFTYAPPSGNWQPFGIWRLTP